MGGNTPTPVDSVKLRVTYTVPVESGDKATLEVTVKGIVHTLEFPAQLELSLHGRDGDAFKNESASLLSWMESVAGDGPFEMKVTKTVTVTKLDEDPKANSFNRDEIAVSVKKIVSPLQPGPPLDSAPVHSNIVKAHFGIKEVADN